MCVSQDVWLWVCLEDHDTLAPLVTLLYSQTVVPGTYLDLESAVNLVTSDVFGSGFGSGFSGFGSGFSFDFSGFSGFDLDFSGFDLSGLDFSGFEFSGSIFGLSGSGYDGDDDHMTHDSQSMEESDSSESREIDNEVCHDVLEYIDFATECTTTVRQQLFAYLVFGSDFLQNHAADFVRGDVFWNDWDIDGSAISVEAVDDILEDMSASGQYDWSDWRMDICG